VQPISTFRRATGSLGCFPNCESTADRQQLRETELVSVRIGYVKETLAPCRISRRLKPQSLFLQCPVVRVHVINSENDSAPPTVVVSRACCEVDRLAEYRVVMRFYDAEDHFTKRLVTPEMRLKDWQAE
jgi:hypothetical protein